MIPLLIVLALQQDPVAAAIQKIRAAGGRKGGGVELGRLITDTHVPLMLAEIDKGPADLRVEFIYALRTLGSAEAVRALKALLSKHEMGTRMSAAEALAVLRKEDGVKWALAEMQKPGLPTEDRRVIVLRLNWLAPLGGPVPKEFSTALCAVLEIDTDTFVRDAAFRQLVRFKHPSAAEHLWKLARKEGEPLRFDALVALMGMGDGDAIDAGFAALEKGAPTPEVNKIVDALATAGGRDVALRLRDLLPRLTAPVAIARVISALARLRDALSLPAIARFVDHASSQVSDAAADAVIAFAGPSQADLLKKVLASAKGARRVRAALALLAADDLSGLEALRAALNGAPPEREALIQAIGWHARAELVDLYLDGLLAEDIAVRRAMASRVEHALEMRFPYRDFDLAAAGYGVDAPKREAVAKIREWWEKHR